ncbi:ribosomal-protein-alanine N-acetyltransferase [Alloscardovia theropitheci]|uniref:Ribosomal-protein-alanine N-acetyltransferase n=1 Tax=Alloscardovia theropitheci TaxID=2496842 RepID=A0A4V2MTR8_9BIFI|nr:ribosomal protein S18-alanine N-acetyltransferase [Alloscardovia theropitheci]TCD53549.1 ribosomal-protein-alanine N-acetyltransferase [Alloscardovia theropitheci]
MVESATHENDIEQISFERLNIQELATHDVEAIAKLERELFGVGAWSRDTVAQELQAAGRTYFVAREITSSRIIGYAGIWFDGFDAQVMTIGVDLSFQRRHIATHLMDLLKSESIRLSAERILLEVATDNDPALAIYKAAGFEIFGLRKRYYQPEDKDAYTMVCELRKESNNPIGFSIP